MGLPPERAQVVIDGKRRAVIAFACFEAHGVDHRATSFTAAGIPPFERNGRQAERPFLLDHIGHAVFTHTSGNPAAAITQCADVGRLQIPFQTLHLSKGWWRNQHGLSALRLNCQMPGNAVANP
ncbi:hypothetical protein D3C76_955530 [compost metagenome]